MTMANAFILAAGIGLGVAAAEVAKTNSKPAIQRTALIDADLDGFDGKEAHLWSAEIAPGAATGRHAHPTQRFVYVLEGALTLEAQGKPPRTFRAGEAYVEEPGLVHDLKNASATAPAKALGFQLGGKGQPLQY